MIVKFREISKSKIGDQARLQFIFWTGKKPVLVQCTIVRWSLCRCKRFERVVWKAYLIGNQKRHLHTAEKNDFKQNQLKTMIIVTRHTRIDKLELCKFIPRANLLILTSAKAQCDAAQSAKLIAISPISVDILHQLTKYFAKTIRLNGIHSCLFKTYLADFLMGAKIKVNARSRRTMHRFKWNSK